MCLSAGGRKEEEEGRRRQEILDTLRKLEQESEPEDKTGHEKKIAEMIENKSESVDETVEEVAAVIELLAEEKSWTTDQPESSHRADAAVFIVQVGQLVQSRERASTHAKHGRSIRRMFQSSR